MLNFNKERFLEVVNGALRLRQSIVKVADEVSANGYHNIFLIGSGGTYANMMPFEYILKTKSDIPVYNLIAAEFILTGHQFFGPNSLVITASRTGTTKETLAAVKKCREEGATVIGLVGKLKTPIADSVNFAFANFAEDDHLCESLYIQLNYLIGRLMYRRGQFDDYPTFADQLDKIAPELLKAKEKAESNAESFAKKYKYETYHILVGAGILWSEAYHYAMCILEEMQWIRTKSVHAAEFFHGTLELVEPGVSVIVFANEGRTTPLIERVIAFTKQHTDKLTILDTAEYAPSCISEKFRELTSPIIISVVLERYSAHLEEQRSHKLTIRRYYNKTQY